MSCQTIYIEKFGSKIGELIDLFGELVDQMENMI